MLPRLEARVRGINDDRKDPARPRLVLRHSVHRVPDASASGGASDQLLRMANLPGSKAYGSLLVVPVLSQARFGGITHKTATDTSIPRADASEWYETGMTPK
jgi:hypothetical protein